MSNTTSTTKWWQGTNFWIAAIMAVFGFWSGLSNTDVSNVVGYVFGFIGAAGMIRERVKASGIDWKAWIRSKNTWNYLFAALSAIVPNLPADAFTRLNEIAVSLLDKNYQGLIAGVFSLGTILYFWITGGRAKT